MKTIWKFPVRVGRQIIEMPANARILAVQEQAGEPQLWALCDSNAAREPRQIAIFGTGFPVDADYEWYVGTFQQLRGALVWHVFEVPR